MQEITEENVQSGILHLIGTGHKMTELAFIVAPKRRLPFAVRELLRAHDIKIIRDEAAPIGSFYMLTKEDYAKNCQPQPQA